MSTASARRERQRAERHQLIIDTARELAEAEGWDAVTTRRLADRIEYSQPVLYSHFSGKDAIVGAVALEGFTDLARRTRERVDAAPDGRAAAAAVAETYLRFATDRPAMYEAMFQLGTDYPFADPASPAPLHDGFNAVRDGLAAATGEADIVLRTELFWSALHGLVTLTSSGRLPPHAQAERLELLVSHFVGRRDQDAGGPSSSG
ncbi:TetR family transcriptional regulator [Pseudonocardia sp. CNS-004]|nr:TetR family transcriptional regulator [Pseudonocardia sp. CNS-004]